MRILACPPDHFDVDYVINPWMEGQVGRVDRSRARAQWEALFEDVARFAQVDTIEPAPGQPDMCFTANAALVDDDLALPARFRMAERRGEEAPFADWLARAGFRLARVEDAVPFEGEGDALVQPGESLVWAGYGVRTTLAAHRQLAQRFALEVVSLRLVDARFYHVDTCLVPLPGGRLMYYAAAFDDRSRGEIEARVQPERRIEVDDADAMRFACNALRVGDRLFVNDASPALVERLASHGFEVRVHPVDEFLKAGGGAKCLSLLLEQERPATRGEIPPCAIREARVELEGHLLDDGLLRRALDEVSGHAGSFRIESLDLAERKDQRSRVALRVTAPDELGLETILTRLESLGGLVLEQD